MATITTRAGKGSPLTNDEVDANFTNLNTDKAELSGASFTGNVSFGDNNSAIFGAGSDLQIFHDGSSSVIRDSGTGNLAIQAEDFAVQSSDASATHIFVDTSIGYVALNYGGSTKLNTSSIGIDVTGTVTADGLTVDGTTNFNSNSVIHTASTPNYILSESDVVDENTQFLQASGSFRIRTVDDAGSNVAERLRIDHGTGDISFYDSSGASQDFYWDSSTSRLGLGETNPSAQLHIKGNANANMILEAGSTTDANFIYFGDSGGMFRGGFKYDHSADSLGIYSNGLTTPDITLNSAGNVGISNPNPDTLLHIGNINATNATHQGLIKLEAESVSLNTAGGLEFATSTFGSGYGWKINSVDSTGVHLDFGTRQNSTTWSNSVRFMYDGRVAIGDTTTNNVANRLKVQGVYGDDRIAMSTASTTGNATIEAQVANYWSGATHRGTGIVQHDSAATGTTAGISNANLGMLRFQNGSAGLILTNGASPIHFATASTNRMTLDASGNLLVGTTAVDGDGISLKPRASAGSTSQINFDRASSATTGYPIVFQNGGSDVGFISHNNTSTTYSTSSDQRLKENIVDAPSASDDIDAIQVRSFDWKADGSHQKYGMVAQELNTVAPEAVSVPEDPEDMIGVDYSKLVPMLVKEIQSLRARVAQLEGAN